jgi:hypothetical protein
MWQILKRAADLAPWFRGRRNGSPETQAIIRLSGASMSLSSLLHYTRISKYCIFLRFKITVLQDGYHGQETKELRILIRTSQFWSRLSPQLVTLLHKALKKRKELSYALSAMGTEGAPSIIDADHYVIIILY